MKLTPRQESFAQAIVSGLTQADAYRTAYACKNATDNSIIQMASKLMANIKVVSRVAELRKPVVEKLQYGLEQAMNEAQEAFEVSKSKEQGGAMVAAVQLRAKLNGLLIDRKVVEINAMQELPDDALERLIQRKAKEAGVSLH